MIEKKITQVGHSWAVIIPKAVLDVLNINPVISKVQIYVENNEIRIKKAEPQEKEQ